MEYKDLCKNTEDFSRIISLKYDKKYWNEDSKENCPCSCSLAGRYLVCCDLGLRFFSLGL